MVKQGRKDKRDAIIVDSDDDPEVNPKVQSLQDAIRNEMSRFERQEVWKYEFVQKIFFLKAILLIADT